MMDSEHTYNSSRNGDNGHAAGQGVEPDTRQDVEQGAGSHGELYRHGHDTPGSDAAAQPLLTDSARAIEAILLAAIEPVRPGLLAELLEIPVAAVEKLCNALGDRYENEKRGFILGQVAGGYRLQTHPDMAPFLERFAMERLSPRLSGAALETLAIVAYKQPVSKAQMAALRGVNVDGVVKLLSQRGYIAVKGNAPGPGRPALYGTTSLFLESLGLDRIDDLPPVHSLIPSSDADLSGIEDRFRDQSG
ncbi:MAG: SMC-Scp complex subunit ScpB [Acidimicrobiales bacterium]